MPRAGRKRRRAAPSALDTFCKLLKAHDVGQGGNLAHKNRSRTLDEHGEWLPAEQVQNHRFDFLNLLACELEHP